MGHGQTGKHVMDPNDYIDQLQHRMRQLKPMNTRVATRQSVFFHPETETCSHVFLRHDATKKPLQPVYNGPYKLISKTNKNFTIMVKDQPLTVSIDRIKPAHLDTATTTEDDKYSHVPSHSMEVG
jgi:cleavage and polyadenylation specificity factor subunit 1